ncbi:hypothetical protein B0T26DRAFT_656956 [Lasiosphaeria miniovina]|uniref:Iron-sulfur assembly protein 1 n=1 Tax=Lasiosphaeria miniovina TaxID=1954250 RepID=A0AA40DJI8_9PEZI|nr:uncharacterized protein B0T26DRAFT_656956 [Lasiosphaeria miniovina]KAK0705934.1 hypothetical protein B0T26DRAFT_656956 [Lasiosphaeria miniovina]
MSAPRMLSRRALHVCHSCRRSILQWREFSATPAPSAATFQSYSLPSQPPSPPRNSSALDTSIARATQQPPFPRVYETRPPRNHPPTPLTSTPASPVSIPEREAQQPRPSFATQGALPAKRSRLRTPRRAAMKLTPAAVDHLRALLDQPDPKLIKVGVRNRGCSGLAYHLEFVDKVGSFDETVEQDGVRVLIDSKALFSIIGSEMDWVEDKLSQRFVFRNPNIKEQCGCGESFMV